MYNYITVTEAVEGLEGRGYSKDFNVHPERECQICQKTGISLSPDEFEIDEIYRFEGMTDPGDEMIVYAISSKKYGLKGILVNAYGMYEDSATSTVVQKLLQHKDN